MLTSLSWMKELRGRLNLGNWVEKILSAAVQLLLEKLLFGWGNSGVARGMIHPCGSEDTSGFVRKRLRGVRRSADQITHSNAPERRQRSAIMVTNASMSLSE